MKRQGAQPGAADGVDEAASQRAGVEVPAER
jgi:hypothetical protein